MAISILHLAESSSNAEPVSEKIIYHLSLDRSFAYICADAKKRERFLAVISSLTCDEKEIIYRQDIIKDLCNNPTLLEQLISMSSRFEELKLSQRKTGKDEYRLSAAGDISSVASKNILQTQALCLKRTFLFVKAYGELLGKYDLKSKGLNNFYNACRELSESDEFTSLIMFCSKYENFSANGFWDFKLVLNGEGRIAEYELIDHRYIHVTDTELKRKGFSLLKRTEETKYPCARINVSNEGLFEGLAVSAISDLSKLFSSLSEQIFERFGAIGRELDFYDVALTYINALSEKNVPISYPTVSADKGVRVRKLYDLCLLMSKLNPDTIVPNDLEMVNGYGGMVVFGNNGSGKTVYLRSVGTMQLLAQAGLPVPCESAEITLFSQIATQFSEAEKEFCEGNDAGRFEQEVRELAAMVNTLKEGALVFLNEPFQSTAYAEGAEGLYHLLNYFSSFNIRWILVSHLRQLEEMLEPNEATVFYTAEGYKVSP